MRYRTSTIAGLLVFAGCGGDLAPAAQTPASSIVDSVAAVSVPPTTAPPVIDGAYATRAEPEVVESTVTSQSKLDCSGNSVDLSAAPPGRSVASDWIVGTMATDDGQVGLVAYSSRDEVDVIGCMSASTAESALKLGLSLASVELLADGVRIAIAVPTGRNLRAIDWWEPVEQMRALSDTDPRFVTLVFVATQPPDKAIDNMSPTEAELARLVRDAFAGTSSVAALGPDILIAE